MNATTASGTGNSLGRRIPGVLAVGLAVLVAAAVLYPVGRMIARAVQSGSPTDAFTDGDFPKLLGSTLLLVVASGGIALAVGSMLAWLNERTDARMGALTDNLPLVPFFLPPIAGSIGWVFLLSPKGGLANAALKWALGLVGVHVDDGPLNIFTWYGLIGVLAIYLVPYVYMMVSAGLRNVDPRLEEQARVSGSRSFRTAVRVTLPACKPSLGGAILLLVWVGMSEYSVPAVIGTGAGIDVFSVRIAKLLTFSYPPDLATAFGLCLIVMVASGCVWLLQRRSLSQLRFSTLAGKGHGPARLSLGGWKWVARAAMGIYLLVAAVLPMLALVLVALNSYWSPHIRWGDLGFDTFRNVLFDDIQTRTALGNSIELAALGATIGVAIAAIFAVLAKSAKGRLIMVVDAAAKLPAAVPSMIMAIGISVAFGGSPFYLSGTLTILLATYVMVGLPEATVAADAAAAQVGNELVEASTIAGGGTTRTFWRVYLPLMVPGLIIGWAFLFIRIMGDLNASVILAGTNNPVVGFYIYSVYTGGNYAELAGLASILCVISLIAAGLVAFAGRHLGIGRVAARSGRHLGIGRVAARSGRPARTRGEEVLMNPTAYDAARPETTATAAKARNRDMGEPVVEVRNVNKSFHRRDGAVVTAARDTTFSVGDSEILVLLGPSGCGKTTLLRAIAGLEMPDSGEIRIGGRLVFSDEQKIRIPPERRDIGMMFQSYALWPHMTVRRNVAYPLECARVRKAERRERIDHALERVGIGHLADQYPGQMSGGQQQRVALARAIVGDARVVLFDEPLSNIDAKERERLRAELKQMQRSIGFSAVYVTHDQSEALALGDRVALIRDGAIEQLATPQELYQRPASHSVAGFIGTMNEVTGKLSAIEADGSVSVTTELGTVRGRASECVGAVGDAVLALVRPERIRLSSDAGTSGNSWRARIASRSFMGARNEYTVELGGQTLDVWAQDRWEDGPSGETWVDIPAEDVLVVPKPE